MVAVLQSAEENARARKTLKQEGLSCLRYGIPFFDRATRRRGTRLSGHMEPVAHLARAVPGVRLGVGDKRKSWDVLLSVRAVQENVPKDEPVLDMGALSSEILCSLSRGGYSDLYGVDLDARIRDMPSSGGITWLQADMLATPFRDGFFSAVTATSVIEHGFDADKLLGEVARLLRPGGIFVASTDYWPDKIDTSGMDLFGMPWTIFSADELRAFMERGEKHGLVPHGELSFGADERTVHFADRGYTFAWLALRKR